MHRPSDLSPGLWFETKPEWSLPSFTAVNDAECGRPPCPTLRPPWIDLPREWLTGARPAQADRAVAAYMDGTSRQLTWLRRRRTTWENATARISVAP